MTHALIIEDNHDNLEILQDLLQAHQVSVSAVRRPDLMNLTQSLTPVPDLVFCDLELPGRDGFQLLPVLRQALPAGTPIIAYTVHVSEIEHARRAGFDGFLGKPLDPDDVPNLIQRILHGQAVWSAGQ